MEQFKAACVQAAPVYMDLQGSVAKALRLIDEAAANGAQLIGFRKPGFRVTRGSYGSGHQPGDCSSFLSITATACRWILMKCAHCARRLRRVASTC